MATLTTVYTTTGAPAVTSVNMVVRSLVYSMTSTASATDTLQLFKVGAGARVVSLNTWADTATLTYSVGDGDNTGKFTATVSGILTAALFTASTVTTVAQPINVGAGFNYSYSVADTIDMKFNAAGGGATTKIYANVVLHYDAQDIA